MAQDMLLWDVARHSGCPVHLSVTVAGEHTTVCFVCRPRLVWNQGLAISPRMIDKDQSLEWTVLRIHLCPHAFLEIPATRTQWVELLQCRPFDISSHLGAFLEAFGLEVGSKLETPIPDHAQVLENTRVGMQNDAIIGQVVVRTARFLCVH